MDVTLTDATIALFEKLSRQLFTKSKLEHNLSWQATQSRVGILMRLLRCKVQLILKNCDLPLVSKSPDSHPMPAARSPQKLSQSNNRLLEL